MGRESIEKAFRENGIANDYPEPTFVSLYTGTECIEKAFRQYATAHVHPGSTFVALQMGTKGTQKTLFRPCASAHASLNCYFEHR
jgi:hypothetical protein